MSHREARPKGGDTAAPINLRKRIRMFRDLAGPLEGRRLLDCGCGRGDYLRALLRLGANAWGVELERSKLQDAREREEVHGRLTAGDLEQLGFAAAVFDLALLNEVLEHVPDDRQTLREVHRVLRPDGLLVVFSPSRLHPFETHGVFLRDSARRLPAYVPFVPWIPLSLGRRWLRPWARNYWPWELRRMLRESGFIPLRSAWVWQTFENISRRQPRLVRALRPLLRASTSLLERTPVLRCFGASQVILARKGALLALPTGGADRRDDPDR